MQRRHDPRPIDDDDLFNFEVAPTCVRITLDLVAAGLVGSAEYALGHGAVVCIEVPALRKRCGMAVRLVIGEQGSAQLRPRSPDPTLVALMVKGKLWLYQFTRTGMSIEGIAAREKLSVRYVNRVINVALLAPDIVQAIERGEHPAELSATRLITSVPFSMDWREQMVALGGLVTTLAGTAAASAA